MKSTHRGWWASLAAAALVATSLVATTPQATGADNGVPGHIRAGQVLRGIQIAGINGIPADATAVLANVTLTESDGSGFLSVSDAFSTPDTSVVNVTGRGHTAANLALLRLSTAGQLDIYASAGADVVLDVAAYLTNDPGIRPIQARVLDSRSDPAGQLVPGAKRVIPLGSLVRPEATVAIVNLTVTNPQAAGYTSVVPCDSTTAPTTSSNNVDANTPTRSVLAFAPIQNGAICTVSQNPSDLVVDLEGDIAGSAVQLLPGGPQRFLDTRAGTALAAGESRSVPVPSVPSGASALLGTLTAVDMTGPGWAAIGPQPSDGTYSTLNYQNSLATPNAFASSLAGGSVVVQALRTGQVVVDGIGFLNTGVAGLLPAPVRVLDTRLGNPPRNPLGSCVPGAPIAGVQLPPGMKALAFTFDDGPDAVNTRIIMDAFRDRGLEGQAMFFWIGQRIAPLIDVAREVIARGYGVGNHSWSHQYSGAVDVRELPWTNAALTALTGQPVTFFRSPGLTRSVLNDQAMRDYHMCNLFTQSDLSDWTSPRVPADLLVQHAMSRIKNGDFVLMHDGGSHIQTALAIGRILDWAIAAGYQIVTPSELLQMGTPIYYAGGGPAN